MDLKTSLFGRREWKRCANPACGKPFHAMRPKDAVCSMVCRKLMESKRRKPRVQKQPQERHCKICDAPFLTDHPTRCLCGSPACRREALARAEAVRRASGLVTDEDLDVRAETIWPKFAAPPEALKASTATAAAGLALANWMGR